MSIAFGMIFFGAMLVVAGWSNVSLSAAARGDNSKPKPAITGGPNAPGATS